MSVINIQIDPSLKTEFIDESIATLDAVLNLLISLEKFPSNKELIENIFHLVHSVKGNASFFGLMKVTELAHELEAVLDNIRTGQIATSLITIDCLFRGINALKQMFHCGSRNEPEIVSESEFKKMLDTIQKVLQLGKINKEILWKQLLTHVVDFPEIFAAGEKLAQGSDAGKWAIIAVGKLPEKEAPELLRELHTVFSNEEHKPDLARCNVLISECRNAMESEEAQRYIDTVLSELNLLAKTIGIGDGVTRASMINYITTISGKVQKSIYEPKNSIASDSEDAVKQYVLSDENIG